MRCIPTSTIPRSSTRSRPRPGVVLDFDAAEQVVGIEMLNVSAKAPDLNLNTLQFET